MVRKLTYLYCLLLCSVPTFAQSLVDVTDQTIRIGGLKEEELHFAFAAGDQILFNFQETNNKELKEVEIAEFPNNTKFSGYKAKNIENKAITVQKTGIYVFRFKNSALAGRVCKIKIQRLPISQATIQFNTSVTWVIRQDTTWHSFTKDVIVGYDTTYTQRVKKTLVKVDTVAQSLVDKVIRVHSETAVGKNQTSFATVELPKNIYFPNSQNPYQTTEVLAWSYWLGVGQKSAVEYDKANKALLKGISTLSAFSGYGALGSLAVTGISMFMHPMVGDNVRYKIFGLINGQEVIFDQGNVVSASGRNEKVKQGAFAVQLYNDNFREGIDVHLKMVVVQVSKTWQDIPFMERKISPRIEKKIYQEPVITAKRVPVME